MSANNGLSDGNDWGCVSGSVRAATGVATSIRGTGTGISTDMTVLDFRDFGRAADGPFLGEELSGSA